MDATAITALIGTVITAATEAVKLGAEVAPYAQIIYDDIVNKKTVTAADQAVVEAKVEALTQSILAALPPADDQDI